MEREKETLEQILKNTLIITNESEVVKYNLNLIRKSLAVKKQILTHTHSDIYLQFFIHYNTGQIIWIPNQELHNTQLEGKLNQIRHQYGLREALIDCNNSDYHSHTLQSLEERQNYPQIYRILDLMRKQFLMNWSYIEKEYGMQEIIQNSNSQEWALKILQFPWTLLDNDSKS